MVLEVHEPIEVSAVFVRGHLKPVSFMWSRRHYKVSKVTGTYRYFLGSAKCYCYAVQSGNEIYEIALNTGDMVWHLEKVYNVG